MRAGAVVLEAMRTRRVVRQWASTPLARADLLTVLRSARWAPAAGNRRLQRYVAVQDPVTIRLIRAVSPGLTHLPAALVVICLDRERVARMGSRSEALLYLDVGTAAQNMLLAAHTLGLGAGPVSSFSGEAVRVLLELPPDLTPVLLVCLGHPGGEPVRRVRPDRPVRLRDLIIWERYGGGAPAAHSGGGGI
jgi:nitroreductase